MLKIDHSVRPLNEIIEDLKQVFDDSKVNQVAAANACSISQSQVSRILDGKCTTASKGLKRLCIYASVNVSESTNYDPTKDASLMGALRVAVGNSTRRARQVERIMLALAEK